MTPVSPRVVNDICYVMRIDREAEALLFGAGAAIGEMQAQFVVRMTAGARNFVLIENARGDDEK